MRTQEQVKNGQWYEFKLDLFVPAGEAWPTDWLDFLRWLSEDHGQAVAGLSLVKPV